LTSLCSSVFRPTRSLLAPTTSLYARGTDSHHRVLHPGHLLAPLRRPPPLATIQQPSEFFGHGLVRPAALLPRWRVGARVRRLPRSAGPCLFFSMAGAHVHADMRNNTICSQ
jgi:hypothetical protein